MTNRISSRIELLRFALIAGVIYIHNGSTIAHMGGSEIGMAQVSGLTTAVMRLISEGLARIAVPLFYAISGYLFFLGAPLTSVVYWQKLKRRAGTLLAPYLFWTCLILAVYALGEWLPSTARYFDSHGRYPAVASFGWLDYLDAIFGVSRPLPIAYQFWFIRDLMLLILLAPAIDFLIRRRLGLPVLAALFALWYVDLWNARWQSVEAALFFFLGAYLAIRQIDLDGLDRWMRPIGGAFLLLLAANSMNLDGRAGLAVQKTMIVLGVPVVWMVSRRIEENTVRLRAFLLSLSGVSFWVFATHEPLLSATRKILFTALKPASNAAMLALYVGIPLLVMTALVLLYRLIDSIAPTPLAFVTGDLFRPKSQLHAKK